MSILTTILFLSVFFLSSLECDTTPRLSSFLLGSYLLPLDFLCAGDLLQLRPAEVLLEEWYLLRQQGVATPQVALWQTIAGTAPDEWWYVIQRLYSNASYDDLILRDPVTSRKVLFIPSTCAGRQTLMNPSAFSITFASNMVHVCFICMCFQVHRSGHAWFSRYFVLFSFSNPKCS